MDKSNKTYIQHNTHLGSGYYQPTQGDRRTVTLPVEGIPERPRPTTASLSRVGSLASQGPNLVPEKLAQPHIEVAKPGGDWCPPPCGSRGFIQEQHMRSSTLYRSSPGSLTAARVCMRADLLVYVQGERRVISSPPVRHIAFGRSFYDGPEPAGRSIRPYRFAKCPEQNCTSEAADVQF